MRFGAVFPITEIGADPGAVRDFAVGVEALGFDHLIAYDHVLGAVHADRTPPLSGQYDEYDSFHEPLVLFGFLAGVTERIELVTGVLVAPQRQTALIAKQAVEIAGLSDGRLRLGLGTGWNFVEYESMGASFTDRGARLDEQAVVLRALFGQPLVDFDGDFHRIDRAGLLPLPTAPIPLWFGGYADPALRRTALLGDGHLFGHLRPETLASVARLHELCFEQGRESKTMGMEAIADYANDPERWAESAAEFEAAGGTHLSIRTMRTRGVPDSGCATVDEHLAAIERWRDALIAADVWRG